MSETKTSLLQSIWSRAESVWDELKQSRALKSLRAQAEIDLLEIQDSVVKMNEAVEKAIVEAKDNKNWKKIREAALSRDLEKVKLEKASLLYEEFFEVSAKSFLDPNS